jgi:hypothetical protein
MDLFFPCRALKLVRRNSMSVELANRENAAGCGWPTRLTGRLMRRLFADAVTS